LKNKFLFSVFVYFIILTLLSLGFWQIYRLNWKLELIEQIENSLKNNPVELSNIEKKNYLRIKTSGEIDFDKQIYLYNLNDDGKPGFEVINPIKIGDENYLLNRGWIPFEKKDLPEINSEIKDFAERAKNKKLTPAEIEGSTFTISNLGMFGIESFTSIINQPNSAILSVGAIIEKPIVKNGDIVVGNTMKLTLACDHRTVDGATGSLFLKTLKEYIENPVSILI